MRLPGLTSKYSEVSKTELWRHETSLDFIKLNNKVDFVLIGQPNNRVQSEVSFWLCICGSQDEAKRWRYNLNYEHTTSYYSMLNVTQDVRALDESSEEIIAKGYVFSVRSDIARNMLKKKKCINLTIFKSDTKDKKFKNLGK